MSGTKRNKRAKLERAPVAAKFVRASGRSGVRSWWYEQGRGPLLFVELRDAEGKFQQIITLRLAAKDVLAYVDRLRAVRAEDRARRVKAAGRGEGGVDGR